MIFYYAKLSELLKQYWYSIYMVNISYFVCLVSLDVMAIFLQKKEFSRCIDTENYQFFQEDQVFVMWNWQWLENSDSDSEQDDVNKDEPENVGPDSTCLCKPQMGYCSTAYYSTDTRSVPATCTRCGNPTDLHCLREWSGCIKKRDEATHGCVSLSYLYNVL